LKLRQDSHDARHHCYANVVGFDDQTYRANDDGEPNHSAGDPILGQIRSFELTNTLIVVIRYFGGTKLGVGGLINAYKTAAREALVDLKRVPVWPQVSMTLKFEYTQTSELERLMEDYEIKITERKYSESCEFHILVRKEFLNDFTNAVGETSAKLEKLNGDNPPAQG
jgi:uncharacterized YigZ family protein